MAGMYAGGHGMENAVAGHAEIFENEKGEEFDSVQARLEETSRLLKEAREQFDKQRTAELEDEIGEAWQNRQFAQLHARRFEYARDRRGPKNFSTSRRAQTGIVRIGSERWRNQHRKGSWRCSELDWDANYNTRLT